MHREASIQPVRIRGPVLAPPWMRHLPFALRSPSSKKQSENFRICREFLGCLGMPSQPNSWLKPF